MPGVAEHDDDSFGLLTSSYMTDIVTIGDCTLYHGDCLEIMPTLAKVDAIVTDPPYAIPTMIAQGREVTRNVGDLSIIETAFRVHAEAWRRTLKDNGRAFVFCDATSYPSLFRATYGGFQSALLVWDKGRIGMGREFRKSHELILHCWLPETEIFGDGVGRADILKHSPVASDDRAHPAEKPTNLIADLLRVSGGLILDPFMGSGSVGVACADLQRKFIGIEIERKYFDLACERIDAAYAQGRLFA
jgi:site-specific DNA-methyltransferase (adenine-specific)